MSSTEHNFSGALATWRDINLSELQKSLDAQGIELVDNQKESVVGRKALADKTKEFKKIPDEGKLAAFKGLLKAYQTEIDNLTKRSKASENAFLNVYKVLAEAPDPYPLLEAAVDQTVKVAEARELETELRRLHDENVDLKRRVNETASIETAKKKAEAKVEQLEHTMEDLINEHLHRQISLTTAQLRDLRMSNDTNQAKLLDHSSRQDQEVVAKFAEVDMMAVDLERANSRVATVERRNEILRAEIEVLRSGNDTSDRAKSLQAQVTEYEAELERTTQTLEAQKAAASELEAHIKKTSDDFAKEIQKKASEIDTLKNRLKQYNDYDEIKRELDIMKYVEFAGFDDDIDEDGEQIDGYEVGLQLPNPNADKTNAQQGKSLEALLTTKNKRLLEELTKFRILHNELENSLQAAQDQLSSTGADLEKQKALNEKLENDLLSMNKHRTNGDITPPESSDVLTGLDLGRKADSSTRTTPIPFTSSADTSILPIVTSQRDRFRQRNAELEEELRRQFQIISDLRSEVKNLQADNLKLYEKVRYMQSYREEAGSRPVTSQLDPLPAPAGNSSDDLGKYRVRYEEAMNPFEAFRGREATRAYQNLNAVERGVLTITRAMLSNRRARAFFIFYSLALHLLVMYTTYECTTTSGTHLQKQPGPYGP
ncbi:CASP C terminal-domain-containing protein [Armillaria fumosa]|nr:CASP C terminal-domain-containing protein [Armillaria fumosa]